MTGRPDDPYLEVLVGIVSELTMIRQELQQYNRRAAGTAGEETQFDCRCGKTIQGEEAARRHAVDDHGAPAEDWPEVYA